MRLCLCSGCLAFSFILVGGELLGRNLLEKLSAERYTGFEFIFQAFILLVRYLCRGYSTMEHWRGVVLWVSLILSRLWWC